jgi:hypothetical protein
MYLFIYVSNSLCIYLSMYLQQSEEWVKFSYTNNITHIGISIYVSNYSLCIYVYIYIVINTGPWFEPSRIYIQEIHNNNNYTNSNNINNSNNNNNNTTKDLIKINTTKDLIKVYHNHFSAGIYICIYLSISTYLSISIYIFIYVSIYLSIGSNLNEIITKLLRYYLSVFFTITTICIY